MPCVAAFDSLQKRTERTHSFYINSNSSPAVIRNNSSPSSLSSSALSSSVLSMLLIKPRAGLRSATERWDMKCENSILSYCRCREPGDIVLLEAVRSCYVYEVVGYTKAA